MTEFADDTAAAAAFLNGGGETGALIAARDWSRTSVGPLRVWPQALRTATSILLRSPVPIVLLWGEDGVMIYNDAYSVFAGGRHPTLLGSKVREGWPEVADFNDNVMKVGLAGGTLAYRDQELTLYRHGLPEQVWMDLDYSPVLDETGRPAGVMAIVQETTSRIRAEQSLLALNADLERQVIERTQTRGRTWQVSPDLMGALNADGYFLTSNPAWRTLLGWTEEEVASTSIFELLHPDDVERTRQGFELTQHGQPAIQFPNRYRAKDGSYRWISWIGVPEDNLVYCTGRDITEERAQADALAANRAERDRVWNNSRDILVVVGVDGVFRAVNPAWTRILGHEADEVLGHNFREFLMPEDLPATQDALEETVAAGDVTSFANRYRHKDGSVRWISWNTSSEGDLAYAYGRDITAEKTREAELELTQEALRQSQKMEAVGQLTGGIAHDFNNMLAVVIGSLDLLGRKLGPGDETVTRYVEAARNGARRAALLTQRLLAFARQQPLSPEPVDVGNLVSDIAELLRGSLGSGIRLETAVEPGAGRVHADRNQLENALLNLAVNARDAMPGRGTLTIATRNIDLGAAGTPGDLQLAPGAYVLISVEDTGSGMPEDVIVKAFDPFFTTKEVGKGTGLGLSQVYGFVKQSGGDVAIDSTPGVGTTVNIYLPRTAVTDAASGVAARPSSPEPAAHRELILVVEDEAAVRRLSVEALTELGYAVLEADGAAAALRILETRPDVDLLFTDVIMPEVNGLRLAESARRLRRDLRVLFTTGYTPETLGEEDALAPGARLISKPFAIEDLASQVRAVLEAPDVGSPT